MTGATRATELRGSPALLAERYESEAAGPVAALRRLRLGAWARIRRVRPEIWWLIGFAALLVAFGLTLLVQPTVGRGGR